MCEQKVCKYRFYDVSFYDYVFRNNFTVARNGNCMGDILPFKY